MTRYYQCRTCGHRWQVVRVDNIEAVCIDNAPDIDNAREIIVSTTSERHEYGLVPETPTTAPTRGRWTRLGWTTLSFDASRH